MFVVGEAALAALFEVLFNKLTSLDVKFASDKQVGKEIENWERKLKKIYDVLADAEERQMKDAHVNLWLVDLQDLAYDVDDILDEFAYAALGLKMKTFQAQPSSSKAQNPLLNFGISLRPSTFRFNNKMMSKIKEVSERLDALVALKTQLQLRDKYVNRVIPKRTPTSSLVNEADVFGRKQDKEKIIDLLLSNDGTDVGVSVIPIVGMGGVGKTTLAQLVYNESKHHFDIHAWACVSEEFDIINVTRTILQAVTGQSCDSNDFNSLQVRLHETLSGKKFLIVLDDVWNKSYDDWTKLRSPFVAGAPGSKIIVTTRDSGVSSIMRTVSDFLVQKLPEDDSLSMLAYHALGAKDFCSHLDLKEIGMEIVKKCDGLPLATKTIGGLLRSRLGREVWKDILESEIWNLPEENNAVIPALKLSYYNLSSRLKQCFAYCSILPKDYEFTEQEIVLLWMAEGFLNDANTKKEIADLGRMCFKELVSRSFFQVSSTKKSHFVMHDLINDLARSVAGKVCFRMEGDGKMKFSKDIRHSSYIPGEVDDMKKFDCFYEARRLRTFLSFMATVNHGCYLSNDIVTNLLPKLRRLRVLSLKWYCISEIPSSIGNLKHLRYLDFSYTEIRSLPDSVCTLYNLETLQLQYCRTIEKLPSKFVNLINLFHLDITGADSIKAMPSGIGELTNLQTLSNFIVGQEDGFNIREMQNLSNLKGKLCISELQNVDEAQYACEANLSSKTDLDALELQWSADFDENLRQKEVEREVLSLLQPHEDLKCLSIKCYAGTLLPTWVGDPLFKNLQSLNLEDCQNCTLLPSVGKLPLLKSLYIKGMSGLITVGNEFYGDNWPNVFPLLETLHFEDMPEWKEWKPCEIDEQGQKFCHLRELFIKNCPKLVGTLPDGLHSLEKLFIQNCPKLVVTLTDGLHSLEKLVIRHCQELMVSIYSLPLLSELEIHTCKVVLRSSSDLWTVKKIHLSNISKFTSVMEETLMPVSIKVEDLLIRGCKELVSLWQTNWGLLEPLRSLRTLEFENCEQVMCIGAATNEEETEGLFPLKIPSNIEVVKIAHCERLEKLSENLCNLTCLRDLKIWNCPKLVSFSVDNLPPTLTTLEIGNCKNLQCSLDDSENINFRSKSLIESLKVIGCGSLKSLSSSGKLPMKLKRLGLERLEELEVIAGEVGDSSCLEYIYLYQCENVKYLPQALDKLSRLQQISIIQLPRLICFPESGLPTTPTLKSMFLVYCEELEALPPNLHSLQLQKLSIRGCPKLKTIPAGGLPITLTSLAINEPSFSKTVMGCGGLHRLTSLAELNIDGTNCTEIVSFPQEEMGMNVKIPSSLTRLTILNFKNLSKLSSNGFQNLTSLQALSIWNCPKLKSLPRKEMLPSLVDLEIHECPMLKKRCKKNKGKQWSNISNIPRVYIDYKFIYE